MWIYCHNAFGFGSLNMVSSKYNYSPSSYFHIFSNTRSSWEISLKLNKIRLRLGLLSLMSNGNIFFLQLQLCLTVSIVWHFLFFPFSFFSVATLQQRHFKCNRTAILTAATFQQVPIQLPFYICALTTANLHHQVSQLWILHEQAFLSAATFPNFFQPISYWRLSSRLQPLISRPTTSCIRLYIFPAWKLVSRLLYQGY